LNGAVVDGVSDVIALVAKQTKPAPDFSGSFLLRMIRPVFSAEPEIRFVGGWSAFAERPWVWSADDGG
jgi:chemotaxis signal transduction protein